MTAGHRRAIVAVNPFLALLPYCHGQESLPVEQQLVAAIDGDNVAFALTQGKERVRIEEVRRFPTSAFPTFTDALQSYTKGAGFRPDGSGFCLAVAGVSRGDVITLPNCRWFVSVSGLKAFLRTEPLIINDFAATAWAVPSADTTQLVRIGAVPAKPARPGGTYLIVGTGSGLGMAILSVREDGRIIVIESEGGHASFAPQNAEDEALLTALRKRFGHVSFERVLSRPGLENIYSILAEQSGRPVSDPPASSRIIASAASCTDPLAARAAKLFAAILGNFVGNAVLTCGAWDGVFLVEPMLGEMLPILNTGAFRSQFATKGRMSRALERVPTVWLSNDTATLAGAAAALQAR
ncbi:glucokinase [Sphingomonas deserti]|uniref:Glucokinase n=1 Tax=Allosphingosinicella deserti TaxID=2116704 RepID=A0A2P7QNV1_9SPHN|nr:glucokinase [Sphingomonas deserti]